MIDLQTYPVNVPSNLEFISAHSLFRLEYKVLQPGLIKITFSGSPTIEDLEQCYQRTLAFQNWLESNDILTFVMTDLSELHLKGFKTRKFILTRFRYDKKTNVIKSYIIGTNNIIRTLLNALSKTQKQVKLQHCQDSTEAFQFFQQDIKRFPRLQSKQSQPAFLTKEGSENKLLDPSQPSMISSLKNSDSDKEDIFGCVDLNHLKAIPEVSSLEPLEHYQSPTGQFEFTYILINKNIIFIHWRGHIDQVDMEAHLKNQDTFFSRIMKGQDSCYSISDLRDVSWINKKAIRYLISKLKEFETPAKVNWIILNQGKLKGLLQILLRFIPKKNIHLEVTQTIAQVFQDLAFPHEQSRHPDSKSPMPLVMPSDPSAMRELIRSQHKSLINQEKEFEKQIDLISSIWGNMVVNDNFKPELMNNAPTPYFQEFYDISNAVQTDMRHFIDELKSEIEERLKAEKHALAASQSKDLFLANMSHELRTPLNSIIGFSNLLKKDTHLLPKHHKYVDRIHSNGLHLLNLINDILDISKLESGKFDVHPEIFELEPLIQEINDTVQPLIEKQKNQFFIQNNHPTLQLFQDQRYVKQILLNLLSNAFKFTKEGEVALKIERVKDDVFFHVKDTGVGVKEEFLDQIFDLFTQVDNQFSRQFEGTGLGLALSRKLSHFMGGDLTVHSKIGKGSCFSLSLPCQFSSEEVIEL